MSRRPRGSVARLAAIRSNPADRRREQSQPSNSGKILMSITHGVALVSHQSAQVIEFSEDAMHAVKTDQHAHPTRQHASGVRSEHEFFGAVCDQIEEFSQLLVTGGHTALADFSHYVEKH